MRKIEQKMVAALESGRALNLANTTVSDRERIPEGYISRVYLHGNEIARLYWGGAAYTAPFYMTVSLAGWNTATTRSRLSALVRAFNRAKDYPQGLGVSTKQGQARIHDTRGITNIDNNGWDSVRLEN